MIDFELSVDGPHNENHVNQVNITRVCGIVVFPDMGLKLPLHLHENHLLSCEDRSCNGLASV